MKSLYSFLTLTLLPIGLSIVQAQPSTKSTTSPSTTRTTSTTTIPTNTNRQQELYDEYHGITKKPAMPTSAPAVVSTPVEAPARTESRRKTSTSTPVESAEMTSRPQRIDPAGSPSASGVRIGLRGGVTYPFFTEKLVGVDPAVGFVGGLTFNFGAGKVSFQPELNYTRYSTKVTAFNFTDTEAIDALEVPLFLKFSSGTYAGNRFFLNVGPYAAYTLSTSTNGKKESLDGAKNRFGFGAAAGVGMALKAGPGHVTIEVRGLYPLGNTDAGFSTDSKTIFGQGTLGYIFPLGGR